MPDPTGMRVIGVGNPLMGDDGFGPKVIQAAAERGLPVGVEALDAGVGGLTLVGLLEGVGRVLIVDAVRMGEEPGALRLFRPRALDPNSIAGFSLHEARLGPILRFAEGLGIRPDISVLGVEPDAVTPGLGLSPAVEAAVPKAVEIVADFARRYRMAGKILIVEDDIDIVEAMRLPLEANGYEVHHAASGKEALERVKGVMPDLIILDVMMESDTEGFQVAYQLRNSDPRSEYAGCAKIPILMLTAIGAEKRMQFSTETDQEFLPVDRFLEKPLKPGELLKHVSELIKSRVPG